MKKNKMLLLTLIVILTFAITLTACGGGNSFTNPGDNLGGGGVGEIADEVIDSTNDSAKNDMSDKSDLSDLSHNTSI